MYRTLLRICIFTLFVLATALGSNWFNWRGAAAKPSGAALAFEAVALPVGTVNQPYNATLESVGGVAPYTFSLLSGSLPNGLLLNSNGTISGTPTQTGPFTLTIQAQDANGCTGTETILLSVNRPPAIISANAATFSVGVNSSFTVTATGVPIPTLSLLGNLPAGLSFTNNGNGTATLSGAPNANTGGIYSLVLTAHNAASPDATQSFTLTVTQAPALTSATSTIFALNQFGSFTVLTTGTPLPTITQMGALPSGVTLVAGVLSGTPTQTGSFPLTFMASNGIGEAATQSFTLTVLNTCGITVNPTTLPAATRGTPFVQTLAGSPVGSYTFSVIAGSLPPGLSIVNTLGIYSLRGTPTTAGTYQFTVKASKNNSTCASVRTYTLVVMP